MDRDKGRWDLSSVLGLVGDIMKEWDDYVLNLNQGIISLSSSHDKIVWSFNSKEGSVTACLAYRSIIGDKYPDSVGWWTSWL